MDKLNPNLYQQFKKAMRTMYDAGFEAGVQAAQDEPESRLAKIALSQAHVKEQLAALDTELDLSQLDDSELVKLISYRGYQELKRAMANAAFTELEKRYGAELFARLSLK